MVDAMNYVTFEWWWLQLWPQKTGQKDKEADDPIDAQWQRMAARCLFFPPVPPVRLARPLWTGPLDGGLAFCGTAWLESEAALRK